jgi:photosystem II stability/assembly factor-like uncharacterized protein
MAPDTATQVALIFLAALAATSPCTAATHVATPVYVPQVINPELNGGMLVDGSRVLLVWGSDGTILRSEDGAHWAHAVTPGSADLVRAAANESGDVLIAVGASGTILRSTDAGRTWLAARNATKDTDLRAVVNQPGSRTWVSVGTNGRVLRSLDDGKNWSPIDSKLNVAFQTLFVDPQTKAILIGGDEGMVGYSKDAGESWQITKITMPGPATPVTAFHRFGKLLLATSALGRFLTSEDDAESWDLMQASTKAFFTDCAFDPVHNAIVMTGHNGDVLRSPDGGASWEGVEVVLDGRKNFLSAISFDPRSGSLLAIGQGGALARSTDGGASWTRASNDMHGDVRGLINDTTRNRLIAFGTGGMVVSSTDSGARWNADRSALDMWVREIAATPRGEALVATSKLGDIVRSTDGGASWQLLPINYPNPNTPPDLRGLITAPSGEALVAVGPPGAILRSNADGSAWDVRVSNPIEAERAFPWVLADMQRKILVAIEARGAMQVSRDDGVNWHVSSIPIPEGRLPFWQGAVLESAGVMLVAGEAGKAARSDDGAKTWSALDTHTDQDLFGTFANEATGTLFLMGAKGTLLRSIDSGASWRSVATGSTQELRRMMREPRSGALLCFGGHGALLLSPDDGLSWRVLTSGTDGVLRKGMLEPGTGNLLLVGGQGALLRSRDGGRDWETLPSHTLRHFSSMSVDERSGDLVLVGERIVRLVRQSKGTNGGLKKKP